MLSKPPVYIPVANLGDVDPVSNGGVFIFIDTTKRYPDQMDVLVPPKNRRFKNTLDCWVSYRFDMVKHTYINGVLSNNPRHPENPTWYSDLLQDERLKEDLTNGDALIRGAAYLQLIELFLPYEFANPFYLGGLRSYVSFKYSEIIRRTTLQRQRTGARKVDECGGD